MELTRVSSVDNGWVWLDNNELFKLFLSSVIFCKLISLLIFSSSLYANLFFAEFNTNCCFPKIIPFKFNASLNSL